MAVKVGATIKLGGRSWTTQQAGDGSLILSIASADDNGRQRVAQRMENVSHEMKQRRLEFQALAEQQAKLMSAMEEVPLPPPARQRCGCNNYNMPVPWCRARTRRRWDQS